MKIFLALALLITSSAAFAAPVEWTLNNVTFDDGNTLTGSFVYDPDTGIYSDVLMHASDLGQVGYSDTSLPPFVVNNWVTSVSSTELYAETWHDPLGTFQLTLLFESALGNSGGTVNILSTSNEFYPVQYDNQRFVVSGTVSAVPIPAAAWLMGSALLSIGFARRQRTAA